MKKILYKKYLNIKVLILIVLANYSSASICQTSSTTFEYYKTVISQLKNPQNIEGIYKVNYSISKNEITCENCQFYGYQNNFYDTLLIVYKSNTYEVHSLHLNSQIGTININDNNSIKFNSYINKTYFNDNSTESFHSINNLTFDLASRPTSFVLFDHYFNYQERFDKLDLNIAYSIKLTCSYSKPEPCGYLNNRLKITSILKKIYPSPVIVPSTTEIATGSGTIISENGYILTNYHIFKETLYRWKGSHWVVSDDLHTLSDPITHLRPQNYFYFNNIKYEVYPVICNAKEDWLILKIKCPQSQKWPFAYIDTSNNDLGESVYSLGYPISSTLGNNVKFTKGYVADNSNPKFYQTNMSINPGNSGGGLFNSTGQLIGITTSRINSQNSNYIESVSFSIRTNMAIDNILSIQDPSYIIRDTLKFNRYYTYPLDRQISIHFKSTNTQNISTIKYNTQCSVMLISESINYPE